MTRKEFSVKDLRESIERHRAELPPKPWKIDDWRKLRQIKRNERRQASIQSTENESRNASGNSKSTPNTNRATPRSGS